MAVATEIRNTGRAPRKAPNLAAEIHGSQPLQLGTQWVAGLPMKSASQMFSSESKAR